MARGSIIRRKTKTKGTVYDIKYRVDGRQVKQVGGRTRKEAEAKLNSVLAAIDRGQAVSTSQETFGEAAERWLAAKKPRIEASTYRGYEIEVRTRLKPAFGRLKLRQVTRSRIEAYLAELDGAGKLSRKTINDSLIPLRQILAQGVRDGVLSKNLAANDDRDHPLELPYERPVMLHLSREQALRYLNHCPDWYRALAEVLIGAGLRIGEAIALEWRDVDWDAPALKVSRTVKYGGVGGTKGDRARDVMIDPFLAEVLREHRSHQAAEHGISKLVFTSPRGSILNKDNVRRRGHAAAVKAADLPKALRLHDLRHTAATIWLAAGESIYFVQQQLGHADIQTTIDLYGHPDRAAHREAAARAAQWWREGVSG